MVVFDMAGTTVNESGIVYKILKNTLKKFNLEFTDEEFNNFHGINKSEVLKHFVDKNLKNSKIKDIDINEVIKTFNEDLQNEYFNSNKISPMNGAILLFRKLRENNIKVCLDTGYPRIIADKIIEKVGFDKEIDGSVTSDEVANGRPYPYMIQNLMKKFNIESSNYVIKVGDTIADIKEGKNANTRFQVGVLTGADSIQTLKKETPSLIVNSVKDLTHDMYF